MGGKKTAIDLAQAAAYWEGVVAGIRARMFEDEYDRAYRAWNPDYGRDYSDGVDVAQPKVTGLLDD